MTKKIILLSVLVGIFISCNQEINENLPDYKNVSKFEPEFKFKKEFMVSDITGTNQAFYAVFSDREKLIEEYLNNHSFYLKINEDFGNKLDIIQKEQLKSNNLNFDLDSEPQLIVELVSINLKDDVKNFSLEVNSTDLKSSNFLFGYPIGYETSNDFIGAVHRGNGYEFLVRFSYKTGWLSSWNDYEKNGINSWFVYPANEYYASFDEQYKYYKKRMTVYPHLNQSTTNYHVAYIRNDYRSRTCQLGTYDYNVYGECYVGTAPEGTTAFIWGPDASHLAFYYTPINGNQCPMVGSGFDGANCYVMAIPAGCEPYLYGRNWLIKSNIIY